MIKAPLTPFLAAHRFGFGAAPGETVDGRHDVRDALMATLDGPPALEPFAGLPDTGELVGRILAYRRLDQTQRAAAKEAYETAIRDTFAAEMRARMLAALDPRQAFRERLVWFWSNHFTVSRAQFAVTSLAGAFEREAIRPHVTGRFGSMLIAAARHPAMQVYLDNARSIGPDSPAGRRVNRGLNENLAREILELHTLGVHGGYEQADVLALARILTGWSLADTAGGIDYAGWAYYAARHDPGPKVLLGRTYDEPAARGEMEGFEALNDLALHPSTARHIARKLAVHFLSDEPKEADVAALETAFRESHGDLKAVTRALIDRDAAAQPALSKIRPPGEYVVASVRALAGAEAGGVIAQSRFGLVGAQQVLGQSPFQAPSPKGWSDQSADWSGPEAILQRVALAHNLARRLPPRDPPERVAEAVLGPALSAETRQAVARAPSAADGMALLLTAPEMLRR